MNRLLYILIIFLVVSISGYSIAANIQATESGTSWDTSPPRKVLTWTLTTNQSTTGVSTNHAMKVWRCKGPKNLVIKTTDSGSGVDIEMTPKEGADKIAITSPGSNYLKKYTTAGTFPLVITHDIEELELYFTITNGSVTATLTCITGG